MKLFLALSISLYAIHSISQNKETSPQAISGDSIPKQAASNIFRSSLQANDSINPISTDSLYPSMLNKVNKLDKVFIKSNSDYNAVSLGIIPKAIKPLSVNERRLYTAGDFKPIHLLSLLGGSLEIDPIINAISGRTKRLKKYIQFEKKEKNLQFLENHFMDYLHEQLDIKEQYIGLFLNYLIENKNLQPLIDRKDFGELHFFLGDQWFLFKERLIDPN